MLGKIPKTTIAVIMTPPGQNAIDAASRHNSRLFAAYIFVLLVTALVVALFTYLTWKSGNDVQTAIVSDSNARIEEAKGTAAQANERSKLLEKDNLALRGQVATLETNAADSQKDLAILEKAASDAKTAQQQTEIDLSKQKERTAAADKALLELQQKIKGRTITPAQKKNFIDATASLSKGTVEITAQEGSSEALVYATSIKDMLEAAGWRVPSIESKLIIGPGSIGLAVHISSVEKIAVNPIAPNFSIFPKASPIDHGVNLIVGLRTAGVDVFTALNSGSSVTANSVTIVVGSKP